VEAASGGATSGGAKSGGGGSEQLGRGGWDRIKVAYELCPPGGGLFADAAASLKLSGYMDKLSVFSKNG
jgi:hypothetical protein